MYLVLDLTQQQQQHKKQVNIWICEHKQQQQKKKKTCFSMKNDLSLITIERQHWLQLYNILQYITQPLQIRNTSLLGTNNLNQVFSQ